VSKKFCVFEVIGFGDKDDEADNYYVKINLGTEDNTDTPYQISAYSTSLYGNPSNSGKMWSVIKFD
jgi:hypothetical protein